MATPAPDPRKAKPIEFTIRREAWSIYTLEGNLDLRARSVLTRLFKVPVDGAPEGAYGTVPVVLTDIVAPPKLRRAPTPDALSPERLAAATKVEVPILSSDEPWNEYEFSDPDPKAIKTKLVVSGVMQLEGLYDNFGMPVCAVNHSTVVSPPVARKLPSGR